MKYLIALTLLSSISSADTEAHKFKDLPQSVKLQLAREAGFRQGCRYALLGVHKEAHKVDFKALQDICTDLLKFIKLDVNKYQHNLREVSNETN